MLRLYIDYKMKHEMNVFIEARERADLLVLSQGNEQFKCVLCWWSKMTRERKAVRVSETVKK